MPLLRERSGDEREALLRERCAGDTALESELRALLETPAPDFLEPPSLEAPPGDLPGLDPGTRVADFEIQRELGRGGMGVVYLASQRSLGREVALKVVPGSLLPHDERLSRLRVEALAAARLTHPSIVRVLSAGEEHGSRYIAMDFVDGADLGKVLDALREGRSDHPQMPRPDAVGYVRRVAEIVRTIAGALEYAHQHGILHRDVKPQNILLDQRGAVFLADFGLAKDLGAESISVSGQMLGTPYYMSPEQAMALRGEVDQRSDVFSLGAVLYELLTLERPFAGDTLQRLLSAITFVDPPSIRRRNPRVHRDLETICLKALEKAPERRFRGAGAFADELARFLANEPLTIRRTGVLGRLAQRARRNRTVTLLACGLVLVLASLPFAWRGLRAARTEEVLGRAELVLADPAAAAGDLRGALERLQEAARWGSGAQRERIEAAVAAIHGRGREHERRWQAALARAREDERPGAWSRADEWLDEARRHLFDARMLLPQDATLAAAPDVGLPSVWVRDAAPGLAVEVREVDLLTGLPGPVRELARTPLEGVALRRGQYFFRVSGGDGEAELVRLLDRAGAEVDLRPRLAPPPNADAAMVRIPAARIELRLDDRGIIAADVEEFWIHEREVSVAQYRRFLRESGAPLPDAWTLPAFRERAEAILQPDAAPERDTPWDDLPMAGVTLYEASAFAEWYGMRLPTVYELDLAVRGPELRRYPWTDAQEQTIDEVLAHAVVRGPGRTGAKPSPTPLDALADYLQSAAPVGSMPEGRGPHGLYHGFGNVKEWTSTLALTRSHQGGGQVDVPEVGTVLIRGKGWDSPAAISGIALDLDHFDRISTSYAPFSLGFRCVKSAPTTR